MPDLTETRRDVSESVMSSHVVQSFPKAVLEVVCFLLVWGGVGLALRQMGMKLEDVTYCYLIAGFPLTIGFQALIRRRPLAALWRRDVVRQGWSMRGTLLTLMIAALPALTAAVAPFQGLSVSIEVYLLIAIVGAAGAGYCLRSATRAELRAGLPGFLAAMAMGIGVMAIAAFTEGMSPLLSLGQFGNLLLQFGLLFPVCFVMEEVTFRGLLDTHLSENDRSQWDKWRSAIVISALWGLWHLPLGELISESLLPDVAELIAVHLAVGLPLSFCWRSSGSLLLPALSHALIDAYRNAIGLMGQ